MWYVTRNFKVMHAEDIWTMPINFIYCNEDKKACEIWVERNYDAFVTSNK